MAASFGTADISVSIDNPYPGLRAFEPEESYLYFGRERQTDELLSRLRRTRFLSVVGTSGSGKSSLVRAGLIPALHSGFMSHAGSSWRVAILRPGGDPIRHLACALADPEVLGEESRSGEGDEAGRAIMETTLRGSSLGVSECVEVARIPEHDNVLLVIDQFEELFRFKRRSESAGARDEAVAFVKLLLSAAAAAAKLYVVITMRSDFIGDCMEFPRLPEAINEGQYLVPRLTRDELRMAITGPAGVRRAKISPRLVARLLNEVGDNPDHLPVLQHTLMRMWLLWEATGRDGALDLSHYREIGTMKEALSRHAEKVFRELPDDRHRGIAERLFKALTETEGGGRGVRRPARLGEVCAIAGASAAEAAAVIDSFRLPGRCFLMPPHPTALTTDSIIDLSHESLMRNWDRLARWTVDEAGAARMYRRLARAAQFHQAGEAGLWRSPELDLGLSWRQEHDPTAAWARRYDPGFDQAIAFLDASVADRDRRRARRELARRRRLRGLAAFAAIVIVLLAGFLWFVDKERYRQRVLSVSLSGEDPLVRAKVLSEVPPSLDEHVPGLFEKSKVADWGLEFEALRRAAYEPIPRAVFRAPVQPGDVRPALTCAGLSPKGDLVVLADEDGNAWIWRSSGKGDPEGSGDPRLLDAGLRNVRKAHKNAVTSASFNHRGDRVVTSSADGTARIWSSEGERIVDLSGHRGEILNAAFSPSDHHVATASKDKTARVWRSDGVGDPVVLEHEDEVASVTFDPAGGRVVTVSNAGQVVLWSLDGRRLRTFDGDRAWFSPDGGKLLIGNRPNSVSVVGPDGDWLTRFAEHDKSVKAVAFSPGGEWVLSVARGARLWSLADGVQRAVFQHGSQITGASFSPSGERILTASFDGTARIWDLEGQELQEFRGHLGAINAAAFPARTAPLPVAVTAAQDGTARVWQLATGEPRLLGRHEGRVTSLTFHAGATGAPAIAASSSDDGTAWIWSFRPGDGGAWRVAELRAGDAALHGVAIAPSGEEISTAGADGATRVWRRRETEAWEEVQALAGHEPGLSVTAVAYNPRHGDEMVTASRDKTARVWRREGGIWGERQVLRGHDQYVTNVGFDLRGERLLTSSFDKTAVIWQRDASSGEWTQAGPPLEGGHRLPLRGAAFRPRDDGPRDDRILTSSGDAVVVWRPDGEGGWELPERSKLKGHRDEVYSAAFSPQGDRLVTASADGTVRVWNADTSHALYKLQVGEPVRIARFSPDAAYLLTGSESGAVQLWRVTRALLKRYLESASSACLTVEQRCLYLDERQSTARSKVAECERRHGRTAPEEPASCS